MSSNWRHLPTAWRKDVQTEQDHLKPTYNESSTGTPL
ncbi:hypothetical protein LEMLEM_LOCUS1180, partial [Lemmus lemmus]